MITTVLAVPGRGRAAAGVVAGRPLGSATGRACGGGTAGFTAIVAGLTMAFAVPATLAEGADVLGAGAVFAAAAFAGAALGGAVFGGVVFAAGDLGGACFVAAGLAATCFVAVGRAAARRTGAAFGRAGVGRALAACFAGRLAEAAPALRTLALLATGFLALAGLPAGFFTGISNSSP